MEVLREAEKEGHLVVQHEGDVGVREEELEDREERDEEPGDDFSVL